MQFFFQVFYAHKNCFFKFTKSFLNLFRGRGLHSFTQFQPAHFFFIKKFNYLINSFSSFLQFIKTETSGIHLFFKTNFFFLKRRHFRPWLPCYIAGASVLHYPVKDLRHPASCYGWHFVLSLFIHWLCLMKYLRFILFFAFFIITRVSVAQQIKVNNDPLFIKNKSDSLKRLITGAPDDTLKVLRLIALSNLHQGLWQYDISKF